MRLAGRLSFDASRVSQRSGICTVPFLRMSGGLPIKRSSGSKRIRGIRLFISGRWVAFAPRESAFITGRSRSRFRTGLSGSGSGRMLPTTSW